MLAKANSSPMPREKAMPIKKTLSSPNSGQASAIRLFFMPGKMGAREKISIYFIRSGRSSCRKEEKLFTSKPCCLPGSWKECAG